MKKSKQDLAELDKTISLLSKIEGGSLKEYNWPALPPVHSKKTCDFQQCFIPIYGSITDPGL